MIVEFILLVFLVCLLCSIGKKKLIPFFVGTKNGTDSYVNGILTTYLNIYMLIVDTYIYYFNKIII